MIRELFLPERFGSYYLFQKSILGFDVGKTHVTATRLMCKGATVSVEKSSTILLESGQQFSYEDRVVKAIKNLYEQLGPCDTVSSAIPASVTVFKEIKLPFADRHKISLVVEFEVEPLLPFAIHDAVIDFIITKTYPEEKAVDVMIAAVQKHYIAQHLELFAKAGIRPDKVTIDFFALYGLYKQIPYYSATTSASRAGVALIDLGSSTTTIGYIVDGQLRFIRSLNKGYVSVIKTVSQSLNRGLHESFESLLRFGLDKNADPEYAKVARPAFTTFWQEIALTLSAFSDKEGGQSLSKIVITGGGSEIKGIIDFVMVMFNTGVEVFAAHKAMQAPGFIIESKETIPASTAGSLATAFTVVHDDPFTLLKKDFTTVSLDPLFFKQVLVTLILSVSLFVSFIGYTVYELHSLRSAIYNAEQEMRAQLQTVVKSQDEDEAIADFVKRAEIFVAQEEKLWFSFANPEKPSLLIYLLELTNIVHKEDLGFEIEKLVLSDTKMVLTGSVRDHDALKMFEKLLKTSTLFASFDKQELPEFSNMKIFLKR